MRVHACVPCACAYTDLDMCEPTAGLTIHIIDQSYSYTPQHPCTHKVCSTHALAHVRVHTSWACAASRFVVSSVTAALSAASRAAASVASFSACRLQCRESAAESLSGALHSDGTARPTCRRPPSSSPQFPQRHPPKSSESGTPAVHVRPCAQVNVSHYSRRPGTDEDLNSQRHNSVLYC